MVEQKYNDKSVFRRIPLLVSFGDFARAHGAENVEALPRYIEPFIEARRAERVHGKKYAERLKQISKDILQVQQGSLYPALHRLEAKGWLKAAWKTTETGRDAKFYEGLVRGE